MKHRIAFAVCLLLASHAFAQQAAMVRLGGSPAEIGKTWGEINKTTITHDFDVHYLKKAAAAGISEDVLIERSRAFVRIVQQAAELLHVSRPFLIEQLEKGADPFPQKSRHPPADPVRRPDGLQASGR